MIKGILLSLLVICSGLALCSAETRRFYIQAEKQWWSFANDKEDGLYINKCTGTNYSDGSELYMQVGVGSRYLHARYVRYMDEDFTVPYEIPAEEEHLNIAGPLLRTVVGDTLEVVLRNTLEFETTLTPFGVELAENDTEGVATNDTKEYSWVINEDMAPTDDDPSSKIWLYRPYTDDTIQQNMGLIGALIVTEKDKANMTTAKPLDTDIEFFILFHVFDENTNLYFNETLQFYNLLEDPLTISNQTEANWEEANLKHAINGKMFCWNDGFNIPRGARARWHAAVVGGEPDIHNFHWHGMVLNVSGRYMDQVSLFSGATFSADMPTDNPGTWLIHCHINDHIHAGMNGLYTLEGDEIEMPDQGDIHQYYIAANEVEWDYTPSLMDQCGSEPAELSEDAQAVLVPNNFTLTIGHKQMKVLFEEYTDATFKTKKPKDISLGLLGPTLRAKVGDTIKILFKNNAVFSTGMHPHGVFYSKSSEGSPYNDGTSGAMKTDDYVHTGQTWNYTWIATERSSPGPEEGSSVMWMYHSHTHEIQDSYAGLMGAIIITRKEMATAESKPKDVDKEYVVGFSIINELSSFMLRENLAKYLPSVPNLQYSNLAGGITEFADNENFHNINGYMYCNGPAFNATVGERVRFYIMTLGTEADLHTPGTTLQWLQKGRRSSSVMSIAGSMQTVDLIPRAAGDFFIQCHTTEHVDAGMIAKFHVQSGAEDYAANFNGTERVYYISADQEEWDYIPSNINECTGEEFDDEVSATWGEGTMGKTFLKAIYREYTDDTFTTKKDQARASDGMAGPLLKAEVGDQITVVFQNSLSFPVNLQLAGGFIPLHNESLIDAPVENGTEPVTYSWYVDESNGPGENDLSTVAYTYGSNVAYSGDLAAGLYGGVVIARAGALQDNDLPVGVDQEVPLFFFTQDEGASSLFDDNLEFTNFTVPDDVEDYDAFAAWEATTTFQTINGFSWCNQPNVTLNTTTTVRWYLFGLGGETGMHTPIFENAVVIGSGGITVTSNLAPTLSTVVDMRSQQVGEWSYWCDVQEHYEGGMEGKYIVQDPNEQQRFNDNASRKLL